MPYTDSIHWFLTVFFFIFGSLLGSFSNVVVLRMAISKSVIFPPSACPKCDHQLHAKDLIPIFSWIFLEGKCRYCKAPISVQYPLVESFMAIIIALSFYKVGLDLPFVCLSSAMAIWFVISTIFVRGEVLKHQPFVWAILYSIVLKYVIIGKTLFDYNFIIALSIAILIGLSIIFLKKNKIEFTRWASLTFLFFFYFNASIWLILPFIVVIGLLEENSQQSNNQAKWMFYVIQLLGILNNLLIR